MKTLITGGSGFIGTNVVDFLMKNHNNILNIDIKSPSDKYHNKYWVECDILNIEKLQNIFHNYMPDYVIHFAARADVEGKTLDDYKVNIKGTKNVLDCITKTKSIKRVIITSTQFVNQYKGTPKDDEDFAPHTVYGESKVITEQLTRDAKLECIWTIIRPTNIWGPWHWRYPKEFWKVIADEKYFHPKGKKVTRSYGYVGNVAWQIKKILEISEEKIDKQVLYVGDRPIDILEWVNGFSRLQVGKDVRLVPSFFVKSVAMLGDVLKIIGISFPITSSRYKSMTTSNDAPMTKTFKVLGEPPYTFEESIKTTVYWLKEHYPHLVKI